MELILFNRRVAMVEVLDAGILRCSSPVPDPILATRRGGEGGEWRE